MTTRVQPYGQAFFQMVPTDSVLRWRQNLPYQIWRFLMINLKILKLVRHAH
jgi:hypothetical protein